MTVLGAARRGLAAGTIGTAAMTAWQEVLAKLQTPGQDATGASGAAGSPDPWERAPAPAKVGRKILEDVFHYQVRPEQIGPLTTVMHWGYGIGWGAVYGLIAARARAPGVRSGLLFGAGVWAMSYFMLVPIGIYQPPWKYSPEELGTDLSFHLVYGAGVGAGYVAVASI